MIVKSNCLKKSKHLSPTPLKVPQIGNYRHSLIYELTLEFMCDVEM